MSQNYVIMAKKRQAESRRIMVEKVVTLLEREDNSASLPRKSDATNIGKEKVQTRALNDYVYNIHIKFDLKTTI